jgi:hypothetical protein
MLFEGAAIARGSRGGGSLTFSLQMHITSYSNATYHRTMVLPQTCHSLLRLYTVLLDKHIDNVYL